LKSSTVIGGKGKDLMIASGGADTFVFNLGDMTKKSLATDTIVGFDATADKLHLKGTSAADWLFGELDGSTVVTYNKAGSEHFGEKIVLEDVLITSAPSNWLFA
jgi:Ca2+-binding RTX toxin-like protein